MAYEGFAHWYDALNHEANYNSLSEQVLKLLHSGGIYNGIVADLGCGTGEISIRLAKAGYSVLAVDASADMLSVLKNKLDIESGLDITILCQDITELDLYGTVQAAVSTFDTFSHLDEPALKTAFRKASLFSEPGAMLVFDVNTIYKHHYVLGDNLFETSSSGGLLCEWVNFYNPADNSVDIELTGFQDGRVIFTEEFTEYAHKPEFWKTLLAENGYSFYNMLDGESFCPVRKETQRFLFAAVKN